MTVVAYSCGRVLILCVLLWSLSFLATYAQEDLTDQEIEALLADEEAFEAWLEEEFTGWEFNTFARLGWGRSDNVLLATVNPETAGFWRTDFELFLTKYPDEKGEFFSYISGTDIRYSGVDDADKEVLWLFTSEWQRYLSDQYTFSLDAQYVYFDQILDLSLSEREEVPIRQRIQYHGYGLGSGLEYLVSETNSFFLDVLLTREEFAQVLGHDWLGRVELAWERPVWKDGEITTKLRTDHRDYDDRLQRNPFNFREIEDAPLKDNRISLSVELEQGWGETKDLTTAIEVRYLENRDNGAGFYDYDQWTADFSLDGIWTNWEATIAVGADNTKFPVQKVERFSDILRKKKDYWAEFFVRRNILKRLSIYLLLEYEESNSNVKGDDFDALSGVFGFQFNIWGES